MSRISLYIIRYTLMLFVAIGMTGCDVHELPDIPERAKYNVKFEFNVESLLEWGSMSEWIYNVPTKAGLEDTHMRLTIRLYPQTDSKADSPKEYQQEIVIYTSMHEVIGNTYTLDLKPGEYQMMVWADWVIPGTNGKDYFYDLTNFAGIFLARHWANTDYRDAFRGVQDVIIQSDIYDREPEVITVQMERPFAKFEIVSNDLDQFISKMFAVEAQKNGTTGGETKGIVLEDYKVKIIYPGYMPSAYSIFSDKPVDATVGNSFESQITQLSDTEASLGFDYVFVNGSEGVITIQIAIFHKDDEKPSSLTGLINIPIVRNNHTIVKGAFMSQEASGGIDIDTEFDGEFNVGIPG